MNRVNKPGIIHRELIYGSLNLFSSAFSLSGNNSTPPQTRVKANNVPMLVRSVIRPASINIAGIATMKPVTIVEKPGV